MCQTKWKALGGACYLIADLPGETSMTRSASLISSPGDLRFRCGSGLARVPGGTVGKALGCACHLIADLLGKPGVPGCHAATPVAGVQCDHREVGFGAYGSFLARVPGGT